MSVSTYTICLSIISSSLLLASCSTIKSGSHTNTNPQVLSINSDGKGSEINLEIRPGKAHNHPSFAIWIETLDEEFIQTLYVTQSVGTGIFGHGSIGPEEWDSKSGPQKRPASLPYWLHRRIPPGQPFYLPDQSNPVPDAITSATPIASADYKLNSDDLLNGKVRIFLEVNQPWDWNEFWHNKLFDDSDYRSSCQPSLIYAVTLDFDKKPGTYYLNPIGHGHHSGNNGDLTTDLSTLTTAKEILSSIKVNLK